MFESFFLVSCILRFFVTFIPEGENIPVTDISRTAKFYLKGRFIYDFIPLVPIQYILGLNRLTFIKVMRIVQAFAAFDIQYIMKWIMGSRKKRVE